MMQWWYGHNAVAFFLTTPFLGLMYYFLPKAAERPVFSYKLSIIHFWSLVFIYIWAGPHHLHYTSIAAWASSLGMVFSLMLWMPSWGGMINGLLTLRGAWHKVATDPVLKFFVVGITFYGMSTFEGPMLSIKSVNALSHYTDWTIAHVHAGCTWLERIHDVWHVVLAVAENFSNETVEHEAGDLAFLDRNAGNSVVHHSDLRRRFDTRLDVASVRRSGQLWPIPISWKPSMRSSRCGGRELAVACCTSRAWCLMAVNYFMTWRSRPANTRCRLFRRLRCPDDYGDPPVPESRLERYPVTDFANKIGRLGARLIGIEFGNDCRFGSRFGSRLRWWLRPRLNWFRHS